MKTYTIKQVHALGLDKQQNRESNKGIVNKIKRSFEKISEEDLPKGLAVVFVIAFLELADYYIYFRYTNQGDGGFGFFAIALNLIAPVASWSIVTVVIHYISTLLGGKGRLKRFLALCGFSYLPIVLQKIGQIIIDLIERDTLAQSSPVDLGLVGLFLSHFNVFKILVLFLVAIAVVTNYELSSRKAVIATLFPDIFSILLTLLLFSMNPESVRIPFLGRARRFIRRF